MFLSHKDDPSKFFFFHDLLRELKKGTEAVPKFLIVMGIAEHSLGALLYLKTTTVNVVFVRFCAVMFGHKLPMAMPWPC